MSTLVLLMLTGILGLLTAMSPVLARAASQVPWLYEVAVPVESQAPSQRRAASGAALLVMLQRLTGLAYVPRTPAVREALTNADSFYNEFSFKRLDDPEQSLELVVQFDAQAVLELVKSADLPIWRSAREQVVGWVVVEQDGERRIVGAATEDPVVVAMLDRAVARGLPLTLPLLDLEDQLAVSPAAVWGRLSQVLEPASQRYGADVVLVGRATSLADGSWQSSWEFWLPGRVVPWQSEAGDLQQQGVAVVDLLADELAARSAVFGRETLGLSVAVSGIRSPADFSGLLGYLRGLEFIDAVAVRHLAGQQLDLVLTTRAGSGQLLAIFTADGMLFEDRLVEPGISRVADLRLAWRAQ